MGVNGVWNDRKLDTLSLRKVSGGVSNHAAVLFSAPRRLEAGGAEAPDRPR
jgi:hypothetical protein